MQLAPAAGNTYLVLAATPPKVPIEYVPIWGVVPAYLGNAKTESPFIQAQTISALWYSDFDVCVT